MIGGRNDRKGGQRTQQMYKTSGKYEGIDVDREDVYWMDKGSRGRRTPGARLSGDLVRTRATALCEPDAARPSQSTTASLISSLRSARTSRRVGQLQKLRSTTGTLRAVSSVEHDLLRTGDVKKGQE